MDSDIYANDTIFALSSGQGKAGVSVFRVSGPKALEIIGLVTGKTKIKPRLAALRSFYGANQQILDTGLVLYFPDPKSFTGEPVAEFQCHGSLAVLNAMNMRFMELGLREARPGEFTRRAFDNGKMDLTEAEGLADLIDSQTEGQRRQALRQMQGGLKEQYENWRSQFIDILAMIEGEIDFPDEDDVPDQLSHSALPPIKTLITQLNQVLNDRDRGERIRSGVTIAIIGPPNAGKSTLINRLSNRDVSIVSSHAGTTRDIIDVYFEIGGLPVKFSDTAGLRLSDDDIESEGIRRAIKASQDADLRVGVIEKNADTKFLKPYLKDGDVLILNKTDIHKYDLEHINHEYEAFTLSLKTGEGYESFYDEVSSLITERFGLTEMAGLTRARHIDCVRKGLSSLERAKEALSIAPELAGDDIRQGLQAIRELAGETDIEAVLDRVFSRFCIGK